MGEDEDGTLASALKRLTELRKNIPTVVSGPPSVGYTHSTGSDAVDLPKAVYKGLMQTITPTLNPGAYAQAVNGQVTSGKPFRGYSAGGWTIKEPPISASTRDEISERVVQAYVDEHPAPPEMSMQEAVELGARLLMVALEDSGDVYGPRALRKLADGLGIT